MGSNAEATAFPLLLTKMALVLALVIDGLGLLIRTLWGLHERRFSTTFDAVSSAAFSMTMSLVVCFLSLHANAGPEIALAFI
ncbi:hypothetical protein PTKIN_Ptkin07bG0262000 [Pterospermum kingtungense]